MVLHLRPRSPGAFRLVHNAEVLAIEGESYRLKEAQERAEQRARQRRKAKS